MGRREEKLATFWFENGKKHFVCQGKEQEQEELTTKRYTLDEERKDRQEGKTLRYAARMDQLHQEEKIFVGKKENADKKKDWGKNDKEKARFRPIRMGNKGLNGFEELD